MGDGRRRQWRWRYDARGCEAEVKIPLPSGGEEFLGLVGEVRLEVWVERQHLQRPGKKKGRQLSLPSRTPQKTD